MEHLNEVYILIETLSREAEGQNEVREACDILESLIRATVDDWESGWATLYRAQQYLESKYLGC